MKKLFKGAVPTLALLLVAVMSLTSVTYAWFTAGDTAKVDTIDVKVKSVDGLLLSVDGKNGTWGSSMIVNTSSNNPLQEVSSAWALDNATDSQTEAKIQNSLVFYRADYDSTYDALKSITKVDSKTSSGFDNYLEFNMYIKNEGSNIMDVTLAGSQLSGQALSRAVVRVAVVKEGTSSASAKINGDASPTIAYNPELVGVWEPNAIQHTTDGETWLGHNGQETDCQSTYMAINGEFSTENSYMNVATGEIFTLVSGELKLVDAKLVASTDSTRAYYKSDAVPKNGEADYYVYTPSFDNEAGEHFVALTLDKFFKTIDNKDVTAADGTLIDGKEVYIKVSDQYEKLKDSDVIDVTKTYYEKTTVGKDGVLAYTKADNSKLVSTNGANDTNKAVTDPKDIELEIPANTIVKYTVFVWIEGQDCDCSNYVSGNPFTLDIKLNKNSTLKKTVTYDANLPTGTSLAGAVPTAQEVAKRGEVTLNFPAAGAMKVDYYTFAGWSTSKTGEAEFTKGGTEKIASLTTNTTLYAIWTENPKVTYDANLPESKELESGEIPASQHVETMDGAVALEFPTLTVDGYTFEGWSTSKTGAAEYTFGGTNQITSLTTDTTLYAIWTLNN